jgi:hypothetical protein
MRWLDMSMFIEPNKWYSVNDVAEITGLTYNMIYADINRGFIAATKEPKDKTLDDEKRKKRVLGRNIIEYMKSPEFRKHKDSMLKKAGPDTTDIVTVSDADIEVMDTDIVNMDMGTFNPNVGSHLDGLIRSGHKVTVSIQFNQ